jgi:protein O-GlcNAc transferase
MLDPTKRTLTRRKYGLPEDKFIFANFNQLFKIEPETFNVWINILKRTPNSVLWLLRFPKEGEKNLKKEAEARGLDPDRIIFTDLVKRDDHVERCALADLSLDNPICNGHTTTTDLLWSGLPVITLPLREMISRVAMSLCFALECPELVMNSI